MAAAGDKGDAGSRAAAAMSPAKVMVGSAFKNFAPVAEQRPAPGVAASNIDLRSIRFLRWLASPMPRLSLDTVRWPWADQGPDFAEDARRGKGSSVMHHSLPASLGGGACRRGAYLAKRYSIAAGAHGQAVCKSAPVQERCRGPITSTGRCPTSCLKGVPLSGTGSDPCYGCGPERLTSRSARKTLL